MHEKHEWAVRLERLERENRSMKRWSAAALVLGGVGLLASAATVCDSVSAERFVVRDSRGQERVRLTAYETGGVPKLSFLNQKGQTVFSMGVCEKNQGYIEVQGEHGSARSSLVVRDGQAMLQPIAKGEGESTAKAGM